jgi:hypothetical protein
VSPVRFNLKALAQNALVRAEHRDAEKLRRAMQRLKVLCEEAGFNFAALRAALAVIATLRVKGVDMCVTLWLVGPSGCGKTTIARLLFGQEHVVRRDRFTVAAFAGHKADDDLKTLKEKHLLPKLQDKILLTKELASITRGHPDAVEEKFGVITHILDGDGDTSHTGAHGLIAYDYPIRFAWIGCSTPFEKHVWRVISGCGPRILNFVFSHPDNSLGATRDRLKRQQPHLYEARVEQGRKYVREVFEILLPTDFSPHDLQVEVSDRCYDHIIERAIQVAYGRGYADVDRREDPQRMLTILLAIAKGLALLDGSRMVAEDGLPIIDHIALGSMAEKRGLIGSALITAGANGLTISELQEVLGKSRNTIDSMLKDLVERELVEQFETHTGTVGAPATRFRLRRIG